LEARVERRRLDGAPLALLELGERPALEAGDEYFEEIIAPVDRLGLVRDELLVLDRERAVERERVVRPEDVLRAVDERHEELDDLRSVLELALGVLRRPQRRLEHVPERRPRARRGDPLEEAAHRLRDLRQAREAEPLVARARDGERARVAADELVE